MVAYAVYAERRFSAVIQDRVGPNRVGIPLTLFGFKKDVQIFGIGGLVQPLADGLKFFLKEDFTPRNVNTFYYWLAPCLTIVPALIGSIATNARSSRFGSSPRIGSGPAKTTFVILKLSVAGLSISPITG